MAAAKKKKLTAKQITEELRIATAEHEYLARLLWEGCLYNAARRLGVEKEEIEDEFGELT